VDSSAHDERWRRKRSLWLIAAFVPFGIATWIGFLFLAARSGEQRRFVWATAYGVAAIVVLLVLNTESTSGTLSTRDLVGLFGGLALWGAGLGHAIRENRRWLAELANPEPWHTV
jgi:hypothetical protein